MNGSANMFFPKPSEPPCVSMRFCSAHRRIRMLTHGGSDTPTREDGPVQKQFRTANAILTASVFVLSAVSVMAQSAPPAPTPPPPQLGALAPSNIAQPRPKPGFDITGTWLHAFARDNPFTFAPPAGFKLTPEAQ